jgi:hypothetical protein
LGTLVLGLDDVALAGEPLWSERMVIRGLQSLPVTYRPARARPAGSGVRQRQGDG